MHERNAHNFPLDLASGECQPVALLAPKLANIQPDLTLKRLLITKDLTMTKNVGLIDRIIRFAIAACLLYVGFVTFAGTALGLGLALLAVVPAGTGLLGTCALYNLLGINTRDRSQLS